MKTRNVIQDSVTEAVDSGGGYTEAFWLLAILLFGAALRIIRLGEYPYWHDEVHGFLLANDLRDVLLHGEHVSNHPPLLAILLAGWQYIGLAESEWSARVLTVLFGLIAVAATYLAGRLLFDARTGRFAALLVAVSPLLIAHSQDLKEYILLPATGTLAVCALYVAVNRNHAGWWVLYAISASIACYSETFAAPLLVAVNVWVIVQLPRRIQILPGWALANIAAVASCIPFLQVMLHRTNLTLLQSSTWWVPEPTWTTVVFLFKSYAFGYSSWEPYFKIALVIFAVAAVAGISIAVVTRRREAALLCCWMLLPILFAFVFSQFTQSIFLYRALMAFAIPYYLLIAYACSRLPGVVLRSVVACLFIALAAPSLWQHYQRILHPLQFPHRPGIHAPQDFRSAAEHILANWQAGDVVVCAAANAWLPLFHYGLRGYPLHYGAIDSEFIANIEMGNPRNSADPELADYSPALIAGIVQGHDRVWFAFTEWERFYLGGNATQVWRWLDSHFSEVERREFMGFEVRLYESGPDRARTVRRDHDDGVSADLKRIDADAAYRHVVPDAGLIPTPIEERRGTLRLRFAEYSGDPSMTLAQTADQRPVAFELENTADRSIACTVHVLASDLLVNAASLHSADPSSDVWRVAPHHNSSGEPPVYELGVAAAYFREPEEAVLAGSAILPPGHYETLVYYLATAEDEEHHRASLNLEVGGTQVLSRAPRNRPDWFDWQWIRGARITVGEAELPIQFIAKHLLGHATSHVDVGYLAFVRQRGEPKPVEEGAFVGQHPGDVTLAPGETNRWSISVDADIPRVDVWVFEHGQRGMAYHIFDIQTVEADQLEVDEEESSSPSSRK